MLLGSPNIFGEMETIRVQVDLSRKAGDHHVASDHLKADTAAMNCFGFPVGSELGLGRSFYWRMVFFSRGNNGRLLLGLVASRFDFKKLPS